MSKTAEEAMREGISQPDGSGQYVGDTWFGHPEDRTLPTHWWNGERWVPDYSLVAAPRLPGVER